jgi:hypothetical protein
MASVIALNRVVYSGCSIGFTSFLWPEYHPTDAKFVEIGEADMDKPMNCPVCGTENTRTYYTEEFGLVEDHYLCHTCCYFEEMTYSPTYVGIDLNTTSLLALLRQLSVLWKNRKRLLCINGLKIGRYQF